MLLRALLTLVFSCTTVLFALITLLSYPPAPQAGDVASALRGAALRNAGSQAYASPLSASSLPLSASSSVSSSVTRSIVAYSLDKQAEVAGRRIKCEDASDQGAAGGDLLRGFEPADEECVDSSADGAWRFVPGDAGSGGASGERDVAVFSAFYDDRLTKYFYVRILGMIKGSRNQSLYCNIWTTNNNSYSYVVEATRSNIWIKEWHQGTNDTYNPVLLSCRIPQRPQGEKIKITLTKRTCSFTGTSWSMKIPTLKRPVDSSSVAVCVKPLFFKKDISKRLVYWLEINRLLGAQRFDLYIDKVPRRTLKVLKFYNASGIAAIRTYRNFELDQESAKYNPWSSKDTWRRRRHEVIVYNDCFYRNMNNVDFVLDVDIDEIVLPKRVRTWQDMLHSVFTEDPVMRAGYASFSVRNAYFLRGAAKDSSAVPFLQEMWRSQLSPDGESGKSFMSTANALTVFNHYALEALRPGVSRTRFLSADDVQMNHYKAVCDAAVLPQCAKYLSSRGVKVYDPLIRSRGADLERNVQSVFRLMMEAAAAA